MTVETRSGIFPTPEPRDRVPNARRQGEVLPPTPPQASEAVDDIIFPSLSPPHVWPRVFPGI